MKKSRTLALGIIITTLVSLSVPLVAAAFSVTTKKDSFKTEGTLTFMTSGASANSLITAVVTNPSGDVAFVTEFLSASDGTRVKSFQIPSDWKTGLYTIEVKVDPSGPSATKTVSIVAPSTPPPTPSDLPDEDDIAEDPAGAADDLAGADPTDAADTLSNVDTGDAAIVLETMSNDDAGEIFDKMDSDAASAIMSKMNNKTAGDVITKVDSIVASKIIGSMNEENAGAVMDNVETTKAAEILVSIEEVETTAKIVEKMVPENVGKIFDIVDSKTASDIVVKMNPVSAGPVMDTMDPKKAVGVFVEPPVTSAARVVEEMTTRNFAAIIEETSDEEEEHFADIMNDVEEEKAAEIILDVESSKSSKIVRNMALKNINSAAKRVEAAVKRRLRPDVDPEEIMKKMGEIADAVVSEDVDALVNLFNEIADLPDTPSTVATILESMQLTNVYTVITAWVEAETYTQMANVFSYFPTEFIETVYLGMSVDERQAIYSHFNAATKAILPEIGEIDVTGLTVTPSSVDPGDQVTVRFNARNVGTEAAVQVFTLRVDSVTTITEKITLDVDESTTVIWTITEDTPGTHTVTVNSETKSFTVVVPEFTVSNLQIDPSTVSLGETVTIAVDVENTGGATGDYTVSLILNGDEIDTKTVTITAGATQTVTFTTTKDTEGTHEVEVNGLTDSFTVEAPSRFTWGYVLIAVIIVAGVAYWYTQIRKT